MRKSLKQQEIEHIARLKRYSAGAKKGASSRRRQERAIARDLIAEFQKHFGWWDRGS